jgi:uroporphyrinogen decarboxylase
MSLVPDFDRFRTALLCGTPDRVPLAELDVHRSIKEAWLGHPVQTVADEVEFWSSAGYDYVPVDAAIDFHTSVRRSAETEDKGTGRDPREWAEEGLGVLTSDADYDAHPWPDPKSLDISRFPAVARELPASMRIVAVAGGFLSRPMYLMGFEQFCYALHDRPAFVARLFQRVGEIVVGALRRIVQAPSIGAVWLSNDLAYTEGLLVSPDVLRRHVLPWFAQVGALCREHGLPLILHSDGRYPELIPDLIAAGINALHPFEPKAMDILAIKRQYRGRLCVMGNVDLGYTLTRGTPAEVADEVRTKIRDLGPGGGYCLGSSNSIPDYVPFCNYRAMVQTALELGEYPL